MMRATLVLLPGVAGLTLVAGCGGSRAEVWGRAVPGDVPAATIAQILAEPETFNGRLVETEGRIVRECPSGCWFWLRDEGGEFYITTHQSNFAIPQLVGKKLRVYGHVITQDNVPQMLAIGAVPVK